MVPIYLKFLPLPVYGVWLATGNILVWLTAIDPGISTVLQQQIANAYGKKDFEEIKNLIAAGVVTTAAIAAIMIIFSLALSTFVPKFLNLPSYIDEKLVREAFLMAAFGSCLMVFSFSITAINQGLQQSISVGVIHNSVYLTTIIVTLFMLYSGFGLRGIAFSWIYQGIASVLCNTFLLLYTSRIRLSSLSLSKKKIINLVKLLSVTFLGRTSAVISNNFDLFFISRYLGPETVAVLNLTRRAPDFSRTFIERPAVAFMPAFAHLVGAGEIEKAKQILLRFTKILFWLVGLFASGFYVFNGSFVSLWVGSHLFAGQGINIIICLALLLTVISNSFSHFCFALGNIKGNSFATLIYSFLMITLIIPGIIFWGLWGAVIAPLIAQLAVTAWYFPASLVKLLLLHKNEYIVILREIVKSVSVSVILVFIFSFIKPDNWEIFIFTVGLFTLSYIVCLAIFSGPFRFEVCSVIKKLRKVSH